MGKISSALSKYAKERREVRSTSLPPISLNQSDLFALMQYDRQTGHLLKYDPSSGEVDQQSIDTLRSQGTIQRLLDGKLIYPSGKLTPRGISECKRLEKELDRPPIIRPAAANDRSGKEPAGVTASPESPAAPAASQAARKITAPQSRRETDAGGSASIYPQAAAERKHAEKSIAEVDELEALETEDLIPAYDTSEKRPETRASRSEARPGARKARYNQKAIDPDLVSLLQPHSFEAEQFKILRTNIFFPVAGTPPRSILVTSSGPGEGKSFASANLAVSIALNINKHVLLIDGDLRKPDLHRKFGFGELPGLTDYLTRGVPLPSLLVRTRVDRLSLLPAGTPPHNPSELVSSEQMANLLKEVTSRYQDRIIVIDSPPPTIAAETGVLARQVDGVLLVVSYNKTRIEDAADLIDMMGEEKVLGSLVNFIDPKATRSYGYRQYGHYSRQ